MKMFFYCLKNLGLLLFFYLYAVILHSFIASPSGYVMRDEFWDPIRYRIIDPLVFPIHSIFTYPLASIFLIGLIVLWFVFFQKVQQGKYFYPSIIMPILLIGVGVYVADQPATPGNGTYDSPLTILKIEDHDFSVDFDVNHWSFAANGPLKCLGNEEGGSCSGSKVIRARTLGDVRYSGSFKIKESGESYDMPASIAYLLGDKNLLPDAKCINKEYVSLCEEYQNSIRFYYVPGKALLWIYPAEKLDYYDFSVEDTPDMILDGVDWQSGKLRFAYHLVCSNFDPENENKFFNTCLQKRSDDELAWSNSLDLDRWSKEELSTSAARLKNIVQQNQYQLVEGSGITGVMPWFRSAF